MMFKYNSGHKLFIDEARFSYNPSFFFLFNKSLRINTRNLILCNQILPQNQISFKFMQSYTFSANKHTIRAIRK